jgi:hypothetical protein
VFTVANTGNSSLILSANAFFAGAAAGDFSIDAETTDRPFGWCCFVHCARVTISEIVAASALTVTGF